MIISWIRNNRKAIKKVFSFTGYLLVFVSWMLNFYIVEKYNDAISNYISSFRLVYAEDFSHRILTRIDFQSALTRAAADFKVDLTKADGPETFQERWKSKEVRSYWYNYVKDIYFSVGYELSVMDDTNQKYNLGFDDQIIAIKKKSDNFPKILGKGFFESESGRLKILQEGRFGTDDVKEIRSIHGDIYRSISNLNSKIISKLKGKKSLYVQYFTAVFILGTVILIIMPLLDE